MLFLNLFGILHHNTVSPRPMWRQMQSMHGKYTTMHVKDINFIPWLYIEVKLGQ